MEIFVLALIGTAAAAAVLAPVILADRSSRTDPTAAPEPSADDARIDREVDRYREALRGGTLCDRCLRANPEDSRFCADCGRRLDGTRATA